MSFRLPRIRGVIDRRLLVNFRVDPEVLEKLIPPPFRVQRVQGRGLAGICLIRLRDIRVAGVPAWLGLSSENAAHRIAIEWDENGRRRTGVFIPRRDTDSWLNSVAGDRLLPGTHHHARFDIQESTDRLSIHVRGCHDPTRISITARRASAWPAGSVFPSLAEISEFFRLGSLGWSPTGRRDEVEGLELRTRSWSMDPMVVESVESSFFGDRSRFPTGSVEFDSALLMRGIEHEWEARGRMSLGPFTQAALLRHGVAPGAQEPVRPADSTPPAS